MTNEDPPELDDSAPLDEHGETQHWQLIGELQWAVSLGRVGTMCVTQTMARFRPAPRRGHLDRLKRVHQCLRQCKKTSIKFNVEEPDHSNCPEVEKNWGSMHHPVREDVPTDAPTPKGKPVVSTTFVDANLMAELLTGRSQTGILHLLNKTPVDWFSKLQPNVETATHGSEFVAARIGVDHIVEIRNTLRFLGVPIKGPAHMFGDNLAVVNSLTMPAGKLQKRHNLLNYHRVREAQAAGICSFFHMDGRHNPADILTKPMTSREWFKLMKPLLFWRAQDDSDGSDKVTGQEAGQIPGIPTVAAPANAQQPTQASCIAMLTQDEVDELNPFIPTIKKIIARKPSAYH